MSRRGSRRGGRGVSAKTKASQSLFLVTFSENGAWAGPSSRAAATSSLSLSLQMTGSLLRLLGKGFGLPWFWGFCIRKACKYGGNVKKVLTLGGWCAIMGVSNQAFCCELIRYISKLDRKKGGCLWAGLRLLTKTEGGSAAGLAGFFRVIVRPRNPILWFS